MRLQSAVLAAIITTALAGCGGGGSTPTPTGYTGSTGTGTVTINPTTAPSAVPSGVATSTPKPGTSAVPVASSTPTAVPSAVATSSATTVPTSAPTSSSSSTVGTIPTYYPVASPSTNVSSYLTFYSGTIASFGYGAIDGGTVTVTYPQDAEIANGQTTYIATGYNGFPNSLPLVTPHANVVALLKLQDDGTSVGFVGGQETFVWNAKAGTPGGTWHLASYNPDTDAVNGWNPITATSVTTGTQVVITVNIPSGLGLLANATSYYAIYQ